MSKIVGREFERLVAAVLDKTATVDDWSRLSDMLLDSPELQDRYLTMANLHTSLHLELSAAADTFSPLISEVQPSADSATCELVAMQVDRLIQQSEVSAAIFGEDQLAEDRSQFEHRASAVDRAKASADVSARLWERRLSPRALVAIGLACSLLLACIISLVAPGRDAGGAGAIAPQRVARSAETSAVNVKVTDHDSLELLARLTKTSPIAELLLATEGRASGLGNPFLEPRLLQGEAWFHRNAASPERGFLFVLPQGYQMEVFIDTNAYASSALSVVELDAQGSVAGAAMSFSNQSILNRKENDTGLLRIGQIATFSETNPSRGDRCFLFTGSHRLVRDDGVESWYQSDYNLQFDRSGILVIGWDDIGYGETKVEGVAAIADRDYNDIRAIIHLSKLDESREPVAPGVTYWPAVTELAELSPSELRDGHQFTVNPHEEVLLLVSSSARFQNSIYLVEADRRRVVWQDEGREFDATRHQPGERGNCVISNNSDVPKTYVLVARHRTPDEMALGPATGWKTSPYRVLCEDSVYQVVGFEDSPEQYPDWEDICVYLHRFPLE